MAVALKFGKNWGGGGGWFSKMNRGPHGCGL